MASPFKVFRKHQKMMLALLGVLVMIGFVILPALMQGMGQRRRANPRVATTTKYGDVHQSKLINLRWQRHNAIRFLRLLGQELIIAEGDLTPIQFTLRYITGGDEARAMSDEALVETWLLARRAEELGLVVDIDTVNAFLTDLTRGRVASEGILDILKRLGIGEDDLFAAFQQELPAMRLRLMFRVSLDAATPAERWDYFQRLNRKVTIESLPVRVSDFLDDVPDPDESTLRSFFDQYKAELPDPTSPEPGFREPKRIAVEYLKAEYDGFFDRELKAVTQEEVEQYYEEHKEDYKQEELPALDEEEPSETGPEPDAEPDQGAGPAASAEGNAAATQGAPAEGTEAEPHDAEPGGAASGDMPVESGCAPPTRGEAVEPPSSSTDSNDETSSTGAASVFRLTAFVQEGAERPQTADPQKTDGQSGEPPVEEAPAEGSEAKSTPPQVPATEATPAEVPPTEEPAAEPTPPTQPPADGAPGGDRVPASEGSEGKQGEPTPEGRAAATETPRYIPLEKVQDEIRRNLARTKTKDKIEKLLNDLQSKLGRYYDELTRFEVDKQSKKEGETLEAPIRPDFRALANEHGLTARKTGLISATEALKIDIGRSSIPGEGPFTGYAFEEQPLSQTAPAVSQPAISQDVDGNYYLFWKVNQTEEKIPEFEEKGVREQVLREWKMIQARDLARKEADRMAAEARKAKKPLSEVFGDRPGAVVTKSDPFSWLTKGTVPWSDQPPWISEVKGVDTPGNDFMQDVFSLKKGQVGTAVNDPKTVVYVVRVADSNPLPETLWATFRRESYFKYYRAGDYDRYLMEQAWLDGIKSAVGFAWDPEWNRQSPRSQRR